MSRSPKEPPSSFVEQFLNKGLLDAPAYRLAADEGIKIKLDQNECPFDWPEDVKRDVMQEMSSRAWHRYPEPFNTDLTEVIAQNAGVPAASIVTGPGSNYLIAMILDAIVPNLRGELVIARPSFALFEEHCRYSGYAYRPWELKHNFEFDVAALGDLPAGSFVVIASPNNPTGSFLPKNQLMELLTSNPESLFLIDEAYYEFSDESYGDLLGDYDNILVLRTLSKTMAAASVRIGYAMASEALIREVSKKRLPYLINQFGVVAAKTLLTNPSMRAFVEEHVVHVKSERQRVFAALQKACAGAPLIITRSQTNFFLLRFTDQLHCDIAYQHLIDAHIQVRNVSKGPMLEGCLRASLGTKEENDALVKAMASWAGTQ